MTHKNEYNQTANRLSYQVSELHREAAIGVVLNIHNFSVVGQDEKLTTSEEKKKVKQERGKPCKYSITVKYFKKPKCRHLSFNKYGCF